MLTEHVKIAKQDDALTRDVDSGLVLMSGWSVQPSTSLAPSGHAGRTPARRRSAAPTLTLQPTPSGLWGPQLFTRYVDFHSPLFSSLSQKRHWLQIIEALPSWTPALEYAALAAATARLGRCDGNPSLARQSLSFYTRSLHELRSALAAPAAEKNDQTLASLMLLLLYEIYECPGKSMHGYTSHYNGFVELIRARGPDAHRSGLAHSTFQVFRVHTVSWRRSSSMGLEATAILARRKHADRCKDVLRFASTASHPALGSSLARPSLAGPEESPR